MSEYKTEKKDCELKPNWDLWTFEKQAIFFMMMQCGRIREAETYRDNVIYGKEKKEKNGE